MVSIIGMSNVYADLKDLKGVFLIFDSVNDPNTINHYNKPKKYRSGAGLHPTKLNVSGSGQPNLRDLEYIITEAQRFIKDPNKIFIVDLRQEPHAFLNDNAVSW